MRHSRRLIHSVLTAALTVALAISMAPAANAITFGQPDGPLHPNAGAVVTDWRADSPGPDIICSGTLIADDVFVTVAHCVDALERVGHPYWVTFDSMYDEDATSPSGLITGTAIRNPLWGSGGKSDAHDIGVVLLDSTPGITPAQLPTAGLLDQLQASHQLSDQRFTDVGYGAVRMDKSGGPHSVVERDGVRRYALQSFRSLDATRLVLSQNPSTGDGGSCYGDSGGPHFLGGVDSNVVVSTSMDVDTWCRSTNTTYRLDSQSARDFLAQFVTLP